MNLGSIHPGRRSSNIFFLISESSHSVAPASLSKQLNARRISVESLGQKLKSEGAFSLIGVDFSTPSPTYNPLCK